MRDELLVPDAPTLLESLRAVGYSFETAIADLIDNSISARASRVRVEWRPLGNPYVAVIDDGIGMSTETLRKAMRHGSSDPHINRDALDLGRFGLGLKTASMSQSRRLTVITLHDGDLHGRCWDLDVVEARRDWILLDLDAADMDECPHVRDLRAQSRGTLVLWQKLDRIQIGESDLERALADRMDVTREHLALVFHRFLTADVGSPDLAIFINGVQVEAIDPFLRSNRATQELPNEIIHVGGVPVRVQPFILPHLSKLNPGQVRLAGGADGLRRHQGFYVYRNRRLIVWGTWFRLVRHEELTKLARVQVDIPNSLDHLWALDIKKSVASPPEAVREGLRRIVDRIAEGSRRVYKFRGRRSGQIDVVHLWDRMLGRGGEITYAINRDHYLVEAVRDAMPEQHLHLLDLFLRTLEVGVPKDAIYADIAAEKTLILPVSEKEIEAFLRDLAGHWLATVGGRDTPAGQRLLDVLPQIEPFDRDRPLTQKIVAELANG